MLRYVAAVLCSLTVITAPVWAELVDGIVATVNTEVILRSDVFREMEPILNDLRVSAGSEAEFNRLAQQQMTMVLEQTIETKLLIREALLAGASVDERGVDQRLEEFKKQFPSYEAFVKELEDAGGTVSDMRDQIRKNILAQAYARIKRRQFEEEITVSEAEVTQFYADHPDDFSTEARAMVRQVFMASENGSAARKEQLKTLSELAPQATDAETFAALAREHSQAPGAAEGGLIGWVKPGDLIAPLNKALWELDPGTTSAVVESDTGVHLLFVEKMEESKKQPLEEARLSIESLLRETEVHQKYRKWISELRKRSDVQVFI